MKTLIALLLVPFLFASCDSRNDGYRNKRSYNSGSGFKWDSNKNKSYEKPKTYNTPKSSYSSPSKPKFNTSKKK